MHEYERFATNFAPFMTKILLLSPPPLHIHSLPPPASSSLLSPVSGSFGVIARFDLTISASSEEIQDMNLLLRRMDDEYEVN